MDRKVGLHHLAFYRGWLQGLELRELADRYLETGMDLRAAKATLMWLRDTLSRAALRHGRHSDARLIRLHLPAGNEEASRLPSLDDFRAEIDPDGYMSERELITCYLDRYPHTANQRNQRRQRLRERQLRLLDAITPLLVAQPVPDDPIEAWFDQAVADRLAQAGVKTIRDLLALIHRYGARWWGQVPKLGQIGAQRIVAWLRGYEASLGGLPEYAFSPARGVPRKTDDELAVSLAGMPVPVRHANEPLRARDHGRSACIIDAGNDREAVMAWLGAKAGSRQTVRAYRKEAERLLLWAGHERGKGLRDLIVEDCAAYRDWLCALGRTDPCAWPYRVPQSLWIGPRNTPRHLPGWRPFDGPLSESSVRFALSVVSSLFKWLSEVGYCERNPWDAVSRKRASITKPPETELTRVFAAAQWEHLIGVAGALPDDEAGQRVRFVLQLAFSTGMRLSEMTGARFGHVYTMPLQKRMGLRWMLKVLGKGGKWRAVPLTSATVESMRAYLHARGLSPDPQAQHEDTPIIARLGANTPMSGSALYKLLKRVFQQAADSLRASGDVYGVQAFERASVHWLRHTCGVHLATNGVPVNLIQKLLGHASLATTSIYTEVDDERLWEVIESG